jgi:signal peptidase I
MFIVSKGIIFPSLVLEGSMEDTFRLGDVLLCKKYYYGYSLFNSDQRILKFHEPQRSDVIDFIAPHQPQYYYLKRCIAIPGDVLEIKDKVLYLNGQLQKENYVKFTDPKILPAKTSNRDNFGPVTIKNDHIFVMGDNRDNSSDSRDWGQLDEKLIIGKVELLETADKYSRKLSVDALESGH